MDYSMPKARPNGSELTLAIVTVHPGARSRKEHSYPGEEIIRVEHGEVVVVFPKLVGEEKERRLHEGDVLHFRSDNPHYLENRSEAPARVFVVRRMSLP